MTNEPDGGAAFPVTASILSCYTNGMSLRDYFAAKAMQGMSESAGFQGAPWDKLAKDAYEAADAMLKARKPINDR